MRGHLSGLWSAELELYTYIRRSNTKSFAGFLLIVFWDM